MSNKVIRLPFGQIIDGDKRLIKKEKGEGSKLRMYGLKATTIRNGVKIKVPEQYRYSWTLNLDVVANQDFKTIIYLTPTTKYTITKDKAWEKGNFDVLKGENKLVIPCRYFDTDNWLQ